MITINRKKLRNIVLNTISSLLAIIAIVWVITLVSRYSRYEITNDATVEQYISPINVRIAGYIKKVYFTDHQFVHQGDTLLVLDDREFQIKVMDATAALTDAEASSSAHNTSVNTSAITISVTKANIAEAKARLQKAQDDYNRYKNLLEADAVSRQQFDQMKTEYEAAQARYDALAHQEDALKSSLTENKEKSTNMEASIQRRTADLELAKLNLSYTVILAPFSGYVGRRTLESGQLVQAGQTITSMVKNHNKWVIANYLEKQIANIYVGQKVNIKVDAFKKRVFAGKVTAISEATGSKYSLLPTDNSAGNFVKVQQRIPVRIDFTDISDEEMNRLRAGMMVETEAHLKK